MENKGYIINSISLNQTKNIICVSSNRGMYLYHTSNLMILNDTNDLIMGKLGNIKHGKVLFDSKIACFTGSSNNLFIANDQIVVFNFLTKAIIGIINLKGKVIDTQMGKEAIYVLIDKSKKHSYSKNIINQEKTVFVDEDEDPEKEEYRCTLLIFDLRTLKLVYSIKNYYSNKIDYSHMNYFGCSVICNKVQKSVVLIYKFLTKNDKIESIAKGSVFSKFKKVQTIGFSDKGNMMFLTSKCGKKIHIFSLIDYKLKYLFFRGASQARILSTCFCPNEKVFALYSSNKTIHFFKLDELDHLVFNNMLESNEDESIHEQLKNHNAEFPNDNDNQDSASSSDDSESDIEQEADTKEYVKNELFIVPQAQYKKAKLISRQTFKPKYSVEAGLKRLIYKDHFSSFLNFRIKSTHNLEESTFKAVDIESRVSFYTKDNFVVRGNLKTYYMKEKNLREFNKIFFFKSFNEIIQVLADGVKKIYTIDYEKNEYQSESAKSFTIIKIVS